MDAANKTSLAHSFATCPSVRIGDAGPVWRDSAGRDHDLTAATRLTIGEVAIRLKCSTRTIRRRADRGELGPVATLSSSDVQLFACGIDDFLARSIARKEVAHV